MIFPFQSFAMIMISFLNIILPLLLLSKESMCDDGSTIFTPSRGFGKRSPVVQDEGIPIMVISEQISPIEIQRRFIKKLTKDEKRRHRMNTFLHRMR